MFHVEHLFYENSLRRKFNSLKIAFKKNRLRGWIKKINIRTASYRIHQCSTWNIGE